MPIYPYRCMKCGHEADEFHKMSDPNMDTCPMCDAKAYEKQVRLPAGGTMAEFRKPIEMYSVAPATPEEAHALARRIPDVKMSLDPNDEMFGIPIARNRHEKKQVLRATGFED